MVALLALDAGELDDEPEELYALVDILNVTCGAHAGTEASIARAIAACGNAGPALGLHPGYADRARFGRVSLGLSPAEIAATLRAQIAGRDVAYVKLHGALYHDANRDPAIAEAVLDVVTATLIGPPFGALFEGARRRGASYATEGFADRRMRPDGSLVPRTEPDALILDPQVAARQAASLDVDVVSIHVDTPGVLAIARAVREVIGVRSAR